MGGLPISNEDQSAQVCRTQPAPHIDNGQLNLMLWCLRRTPITSRGSSWDESGPCSPAATSIPVPGRWIWRTACWCTTSTTTLRERFQQERDCILAIPARISHFDQIEAQIKDYPDQVRKLLARLHRVKAHLLLKRIIGPNTALPRSWQGPAMFRQALVTFGHPRRQRGLHQGRNSPIIWTYLQCFRAS